MSPTVTVIGCDGRPLGPEATQALATARLVSRPSPRPGSSSARPGT